MAESNSTICTDMDPTIYISGECHSTNNEYYEPSIDIITGNRNQSNQDVDLDDTEVVTMTDNIYYQLYDINQWIVQSKGTKRIEISISYW